MYQNVGEGRHYTTYIVNLGAHEEKILIKTALLISYHILGSVITILILAEAQKPRRRIGIAEWKAFARLESFLRVSKVHLFRTES